MINVVVTDGEQRAALAATRSLGAAGHRVHVCSAIPGSLAAASRHSATSSIVSDPLTRPRAFCDEVERLCSSVSADVLIPITEPSLLAVLPFRERFKSRIPFSSSAAFEDICNKQLVLERATAHGIAVPGQSEMHDAGDLTALPALKYPVVIKPSRSVSGSEGERVRTSVAYAENEAELRKLLKSIPDAAYPLLLQQRIVGPGFGLSLMIWEGELRAAFAHRRLREKPPSGGVSVLRESVALDEANLERCVALLREFSWQGVAMLEFKLDSATGKLYMMEINGRLWGSLQLAIDAGVDFPRLLVDAAMEIDTPPVLQYQIGAKSRWEWGDIDHLLAMLFHSPETLSLPAGQLRRSSAIGQFLQSFAPGTRSEIFRTSDPAPFFRESVNWVRRR